MTNDPNAIVFNGAGKPLEEKNYEIPDIKNDDELVTEFGVQLTIKMCKELMSNGIKGLHI